MDKITPAILKTWSPCTDGYKRFCELFPDGADLDTAIAGLAADGHDDWGYWLFNACREKKLFSVSVANGYRNSGYRNSGDRNSGYRNSGDLNSGYLNSGDLNSGDLNSGDLNSGDRNSGDLNSGYRNSGDLNSGDLNSGDLNSGYRNSGGWNRCNFSTGFFNTQTPEDILIFNKPCKREIWDKADKPYLLFFDVTEWIGENNMTDAEKVANPKFYVCGGYVKRIPYQDAFKKSYENASASDRKKLLALPNFDAEIFLEISGIDLRK